MFCASYSIMENGRTAASCSPAARNYQLPSFSSCLPPVLSLKADSISTQCSEIIDHFSMEIAQAMAPKTVVRVYIYIFAHDSIILSWISLTYFKSLIKGTLFENVEEKKLSI